ncbi:hypothetical protein PR202_ga10782 [Eleusine coracana subsp. coracana]|uniref:Uncharacterized protein n=1 Tax=Eleusine coracana subsp. coracana TaxID=191504 RepID=A0AAV5C7K3_ELECO|nr:hypothetical protein PR202_ga10782 [Eleusine coracana subsp. coracana]
MEVQKADLPSLALGVDDSGMDLPCVSGDDMDLPSRGDDGAELPWWRRRRSPVVDDDEWVSQLRIEDDTPRSMTTRWSPSYGLRIPGAAPSRN